MNTKIKCGAGKVLITPPDELIRNLYGLMGHYFIDKYSELYVRVIALEQDGRKALLVAFELDKAPEAESFIPELSARTGVPESAILYVGIHTHTAPLHGARVAEGPNAKSKKTPEQAEATTKYEGFLRVKLFEAADEAIASLEPCRIGWQTGKSYINENRVQHYEVLGEDGLYHAMYAIGSNPDAPVDRTLFVLRAEREDGSCIATLINYPVHCVVMIFNDCDGKGGSSMGSDLAGAIAQMVEDKEGGIAIWTSGAAGDINPVMMNQFNHPDPVTGAASEFHVQGLDYAEASLKLLSLRHFDDINRTKRGIDCNKSDCAISSVWEMGSRAAENGKTYPVRLRLIRIGTLAFVGVSGELFSSYAPKIKAIIKENLPEIEEVVLFNHDASTSIETGYMPDDETLKKCAGNDAHHGLPGVGRFPLKEGELGELLADLTAELTRKIN